ncbi:MAG: C39 family peptidase [Bdellovibrionales bacterium]
MNIFLPSALLTVLLVLPAFAADMVPGMSGAGTMRLPVKNMSEMRFTHMIKQKYDFSCGAAAIAALLTYHYEMPSDEAGILKAMYETGDKEKIHKAGFSMLDMKKYLQSVGFTAEGYRASIDKLAAADIPAIVLINNKGYMHFVVVKGVSSDHVLLGDPATGARIVTRDAFNKSWNGILFVITSHTETAQPTFNVASEWQRLRAPVVAGMGSAPLSNLALDTALTPNYYR